jgi:hypothetical protein
MVNSSNLDQNLSRSLPRLQILVHPPDVLQRISIVNLDVELSIEDELEELLGVGGKFFACGDIVEEGRSEKSEVFGGQSTLSMQRTRGQKAMIASSRSKSKSTRLTRWRTEVPPPKRYRTRRANLSS